MSDPIPHVINVGSVWQVLRGPEVVFSGSKKDAYLFCYSLIMGGAA